MHLAPHIYIARIDSRSIVLDLERDRYIGLNPDLSDALHSLLSSAGGDCQMPADGKGALAKLRGEGLLIDQDKHRSHRNSHIEKLSHATAPLPTSSLWALLPNERATGEPISFVGMMSSLVSLTQVAASLRVRSFKSTIKWLANIKAVPRRRTRLSKQNLIRAEALGAIQTLVDAFDEIRPYFPLKPICRLDALALCLHLRRNGQDAQVVFGVRLDPFVAHCWVQIGEIAISDAWAVVRGYSPILVI